MIDPEEMWVLEWSREQKCFHIETVEEMLTGNLDAFVVGHESQYVPLYFCATRGEATVCSRRLRDLKCESSKEMKSKWDAIWHGEPA